MPNMLQAALAYAARGWPVFPCHGSLGEVNEKGKADKSPYTTRGAIDATTNAKTITEWWTRWPDANIGFHPGEVDLMVLDFDPGSDIDAVAKRYDLPETHLAALTPRGGQHEFYAIPPGAKVPPSASKVAPSVDVRSWHSYVLLAPSRTKDGEYTWAAEGKPAAAPQALVAAAIASKHRPADDPKRVNVRPDQEHNQKAYIEWIEKHSKPAIEGQGGNSTLTATAAMGHSFGLTPETTLEILAEYYNPRCVPPWGDDEAEDFAATVGNGHRYASSAQGNMTEDYRQMRIRERAEATRTLFEVHRREVEAEGEVAEEAGSKSRFKVWTIPELRRRKPPEWLLKEVLAEQGHTILYGPSGAFKSFMALDWALSVATGTDWQGFPVRRGRVLYGMGEGMFDPDKRIDAWCSKHGVLVPPASDFKVIEPLPMLRERDDVADFLSEAEAKGPWDLVVIDTIGRVMPGLDDHSAQGAREYSSFVTMLRKRLGAATLSIAHAPKDKPTALLGSGAYEQDADALFNMTITERGERVALRNAKQKAIAEWEQVRHFKRAPVEASLVLEHVNDSIQARATAVFTAKEMREIKEDDRTSRAALAKDEEAARKLARLPVATDYNDTELAKWLAACFKDGTGEETWRKYLRILRANDTKTAEFYVLDAGVWRNR